MIRNNMLAFVSAIVLLILVISTGCEDRRFESERLKLASEIEVIMIKQGLCPISSGCNAKVREIYFATPAIGGFSIQLWKVDKNTQELVIKACENMYLKKNKKINIYVEIFNITHEEMVAQKKMPSPNKTVSFTSFFNYFQ